MSATDTVVVPPTGEKPRGDVLIVEDSPIIRKLVVDQVSKLGHNTREAENGRVGLERMREKAPDAVILDLMMPEVSGQEVLLAMRADPALKQVPVIIVTALGDMDKIIYCIEHGADDYMQKPFRAPILKARLEAVIERKRMHDREIELQQQLSEHNARLEERVRAQVKEITAAQTGAIFAMCKLSESRDLDTGQHLERVREFCRLLARRYIARPENAARVTPTFVEDIFIASPLHDIGKVGVPDMILNKPGKLTDSEFELMKTHSAIGAEVLRDVNEQHPGNTFLAMGIEITRHHHEKWDGSGYPDQLKGEAIPVAARITALADVYDALTHPRCYKPAFSHEDSARIIFDGSGKHFDPSVVALFKDSLPEFERILHELD